MPDATQTRTQPPAPNTEQGEPTVGGIQRKLLLIAGVVIITVVIVFLSLFTKKNEAPKPVTKTESAAKADTNKTITLMASPDSTTKPPSQPTASAAPASIPAPASAQNLSIMPSTAPGTNFVPTPAQVESLARMNPTDLYTYIQTLKAQKQIWDFKKDGAQKAAKGLYEAAFGLDGQTIPPAPLTPTATPNTPTLNFGVGSNSGNIGDTILQEVRRLKRELKEHRAGARAANRQAVSQRTRIEDKLQDVDNNVITIQSDFIAAKQHLTEVIQASKNGLASKEDLDQAMAQMREAMKKYHR